MNELERSLQSELDELVKVESLGKYHSLSDIPAMNRAMCAMKIVISVILLVGMAIVIWNQSPIMLMLGIFPYELPFFVFAKIMEFTLLFCIGAILVQFSRKTCKDGIDKETKLILNSYITPSPKLLKAYRDARKQMINSGEHPDDWDHKKLISIDEVNQFLQQYKKL